MDLAEELRLEGLQPNTFTLSSLVQGCNFKSRGSYREAYQVYLWAKELGLPLEDILPGLLEAFRCGIFRVPKQPRQAEEDGLTQAAVAAAEAPGPERMGDAEVLVVERLGSGVAGLSLGSGPDTEAPTTASSSKPQTPGGRPGTQGGPPRTAGTASIAPQSPVPPAMASRPATSSRPATAIFPAPTLEESLEAFDLAGRVPEIADDVSLYEAAIRACGRARDGPQALEIFLLFESLPTGPSATRALYHALIDALIAASDVEAAMNVFEWMNLGRARLPFEEQPDSAIFHSLLRACYQHVMLEKALEVLAYMDAYGIDPEPKLYNEVVNAVDATELWDTKILKPNPRAHAANVGKLGLPCLVSELRPGESMLGPLKRLQRVRLLQRPERAPPQCSGL